MIVDLHEAEGRLSELLDRASRGEEIVITVEGAPRARLVGLSQSDRPREPVNALHVTYIAEDFDAVDEAIAALFSR